MSPRSFLFAPPPKGHILELSTHVRVGFQCEHDGTETPHSDVSKYVRLNGVLQNGVLQNKRSGSGGGGFVL